MKKFIIGLFVLCSFIVTPVFLIGSNNGAIVAIAEETHLSTVVVPESEHGKIEASVLEGNPGDIVELSVAPDAFYELSSLSVNGVSLIKNEEGKYVFALVEGENMVQATFILSETEVGKIVSVINSVKSDWRNIFTVDNIVLLITFLVDSGALAALVIILAKYKKTKTIDRKELISAINNVLPKEAEKIIAKIFDKEIVPALSKISVDSTQVKAAMIKFIQAYLYSLEGTLESKDKIISLLSELEITDESVVNALKEWILARLEEVREENRKNIELLEALKNEGNTLPHEDPNNGASEGETEAEEAVEENHYDGTEI